MAMRIFALATLLLSITSSRGQVSSAVGPPDSAPGAGAASGDTRKTRIEVPRDRPDPLFDLPPLQHSKASLLGGTVDRVDRVRDRLVLRSFGGGKLEIAFDPRTQFMRGDAVANVQDLHAGDRVHVETVLDGTRVFAKKIHIGSADNTSQGEARGQVLDYDTADGHISINDELSARALRFRVSESTKIIGERLGPGALVQVGFRPGTERPLAEEIHVLAIPGDTFKFVGRLTYLDLLTNKLVVANTTDNRKYDIKFSPTLVDTRTLHEESNVAIDAQFDGQHYLATSITLLRSAVLPEQAGSNK